MELKDLLVTPFIMIILLVGAYMFRPATTNPLTKKYFIPALLVKFGGAIALGLIYQFYYGGGDTFNYHTHGSRWIWEAFMDNPALGVKTFLATERVGETFKYTSRIWLFREHAALTIIKIAAFFDLFTFSTYSATALFFATFAFSGHWVLFTSFQKLYPDQTKHLAIACLFVPTVVFWGSGILKDSVTLACLCWMTHCMFEISIFRKKLFINLLLLLFFAWIIYSIKIYILLCFLVAASLFLYKNYIGAIKNAALKMMLAPFLIVFFLGGGYYMMQKISEGNSRYALDKIGQTAMITAYDIKYGWGARHGENSGYDLGELDGSIGSLIALAPKGINVTLFRPWLWEVRNPFMLLSAIESLIFLLLTLRLVLKTKWSQLWRFINQPIILFCLSFSLMFAFAVGVSTYNFGTLARYKIPVMPFYSLFILIAIETKKQYHS